MLKNWWKVKQAKCSLADLIFVPEQQVPWFKEKQSKKVKFGQTFMDYLHIVYDAIQMQVSENLSLNGEQVYRSTGEKNMDFMGTCFFQWIIWRVYPSIPTKCLLRSLIINSTYQDVDFSIITG